MSNTSAELAAGRIRRIAATFGALVVGALGVGVVGTPSPALAEPAPQTMTFRGSLNLLGLLSSLNVSPAAVSIPAGGKVRFVNASGADLHLTVGGRQFTLTRAGGDASETLVFMGASQAQRVTAQATPVKGIVGQLLASNGAVNIAAAPPPKSTSPKPPASKPATGSPAPNTPGAPTRPNPPGGAVPQVLGPDGVALPPNFGRNPVARGGMASAGLPPITEEEAGMASADPTGPVPDESADRDSTRAGSPASRVTSIGGGIGLLILVATVLLGGVGSAAIRTVLAQRSVDTQA